MHGGPSVVTSSFTQPLTEAERLFLIQRIMGNAVARSVLIDRLLWEVTCLNPANTGKTPEELDALRSAALLLLGEGL